MDDKSKEEFFDSTEIIVEEIEKSNKSDEWEFVSEFEVDSYPVPYISVPKMRDVLESCAVGSYYESDAAQENPRLEQQKYERKEEIQVVKKTADEKPNQDDKIQVFQTVEKDMGEKFPQNKQKQEISDWKLKKVVHKHDEQKMQELKIEKAQRLALQDRDLKNLQFYGQQSEIKSNTISSIDDKTLTKSSESFTYPEVMVHGKSYERICFEIEEAMNDIVESNADRISEPQIRTSKCEFSPKKENQNQIFEQDIPEAANKMYTLERKNQVSSGAAKVDEMNVRKYSQVAIRSTYSVSFRNKKPNSPSSK